MTIENQIKPEKSRTRPAVTVAPVWGVAFVLALALLAQWLGEYLPLLGASITGLVLGVVLRLSVGLPEIIAPGVRLASKQLLKLAIVLLGAGMSLGQIWVTGSQAVLIILTTIVLGIAVSSFLGKHLGVSYELSQLIGVGTSICGATAIATTAPIIRANEMDTAYAVSTIFTFNLLAVFLYPIAGHLLGLSDASFGTWVGTAIQDTSSVVAAGYAYTDQAGDIATITKLTRTLFLLPIAMLIGVSYSVRAGGEKAGGAKLFRSAWKAFPTFLFGFLALALTRTAGILPDFLLEEVYTLGKFLIVVALVAIGLSSDLREMRKSGLKPLFLGLAAAGVVGVTSLILIRVIDL